MNAVSGTSDALALGGAVWDDKQHQFLVSETENWHVTVRPMFYNDRLLLSHKAEYPRTWTAGFCYDKGPGAILAARVFNPERERWPIGFKKIAADSRSHQLIVAAFGDLATTQPLCEWCWREVTNAAGKPLHGADDSRQVCCMCGTVTTHGLFEELDPYVVSYPRLAEDR